MVTKRGTYQKFLATEMPISPNTEIYTHWKFLLLQSTGVGYKENIHLVCNQAEQGSSSKQFLQIWESQ